MNYKISKTFLFRECVMNRHSIALHFVEPVIVDKVEHKYAILQDFGGEQSEKEMLFKSALEGKDIYGTFYGKLFFEEGEPDNLTEILLDTEKIAKYEIR